jgi:hypothetical protein
MRAGLSQDYSKNLRRETASMNIPNFHDGHFDGLLIGTNKLANLFLRTQDGKSFSLTLQEVDALTLSEIKQGTSSSTWFSAALRN